ncbi:MAG: penicillin-binding Tp47 domain C-containing protein [Blautia sp.]|uniref:penicillin-binding Tp47 domain C-containing protein n=1 Tax=Blautia sp. TaxID=1955243 RepID=UPI002A818850|nr:penicillin-binding Tp47 domain C-containing protein [Blautia sp.]MDY4116283.1 penicillin-binding Tp47 domain C-containing protein [Blautia sp.]
MRKGNLIKMAAPAILSAAMMVSGLPVMAADFTEDTAVEASVDEFGEAEDTADAFASDEETPFVDDQTAAEDEFAATAEDGYKYVYAGLTWTQYWASESVYNAANTDSNSTVDSHNELDKGGFDTVTRATVNHGLHRGSYQCEAIMYDANGDSYEISYWTSANDAVLTDGSTIKLNQPERNQITKADGSVVDFASYKVVGLKYVPVAVKAEDYDAFKAQYKVVEDGSTVAGGYGEGNLQSYTGVADVTAETNGLKEAVKGADGTFTFQARKTGTGSGLKDESLQTASNVTATVKEASGSYGEFLRVDITGDGYGALGSKMYAVRWDYYGNGDTVLASYGTKFAADNWMHKAMGIQLSLTDSYRCQLPSGTDGTGKWKLTVYAMGYADTVFEVTATNANIVKPATEEADTTTLKAAVEKASALKEADYTADSWKAMQLELEEAKDLLAKEKPTQAEVDEATTHLNAAVEALVKADKVTITLNKKTATIYKGKTTTLKATVTGAEAAKVTFTSNNTKVATVNKTTGKVTAKAKGTATITAKYGDVKVTCKVTVKNPTLTLSKTSASVKVGKTTKITAKATPSGKVTYKSSNKKVATVSSNGTIKGIKKGTAKITVTCNGVSKTVKVTVK